MKKIFTLEEQAEKFKNAEKWLAKNRGQIIDKKKAKAFKRLVHCALQHDRDADGADTWVFSVSESRINDRTTLVAVSVVHSRSTWDTGGGADSVVVQRDEPSSPFVFLIQLPENQKLGKKLLMT